MTEDEMVGWHHLLSGREFGWSPGVGDGQGGLVCCSSWGRKELDTTEQLNCTVILRLFILAFFFPDLSHTVARDLNIYIRVCQPPAENSSVIPHYT